MMQPKVLIVDDQETIRDSLRDVLKNSGKFCVMSPAASGAKALELMEADRPDIVLMDIRMPEMSGVETTAKMHKHGMDDVSVIFFTLFNEPELVFEALSRNVAGFLLKDIDRDQLIRSIETVANGGVVFDPDVARQITGIVSTRASRTQVSCNGQDQQLTKREIDVVTLLSEGLANKEIAKVLELSDGTVRNYVSSVLEKLDASNRTQAVVRALEAGLLRSDK